MRPLAMFRSVLLVVAAGTACDRSLPTNLKPRATLDAVAATAPEANNFVAHLTGSDEVPSHHTRAVGQVNFHLNVQTHGGGRPPHTGPGDFPGGRIRGQIPAAGPTR